MKILVVHQNFPGQFRRLVPALMARGHEVTGTRMAQGQTQVVWEGVRVMQYFPRTGSSPRIHPWLVDFETKLIRAEAWATLARQMKDDGYTPDLVLAHPGWGETLFLRHVWPDARLYTYNEFYYRAENSDLNFDPEFSTADTNDGCRMAVKNINNDYHLQIANKKVSPTEWQRSTYPEQYARTISVIHDGVDTDKLSPDTNVSYSVNETLRLDADRPLITFVSRVLEPYRGFHTFIRSLPEILTTNNDVYVAIVGGDGKGYGDPAKAGNDWGTSLWHDIAKNLSHQQKSRVLFLGQLPYAQFVNILRLSQAHVYLTYPFVLSWSLLEAMSLACPVVGSATPPVQEVLEHERNGLLVDFFNPEELSQAVLRLLNEETLRRTLGEEARKRVREKYDLQRVALPKWIDWLETE